MYSSQWIAIQPWKEPASSTTVCQLQQPNVNGARLKRILHHRPLSHKGRGGRATFSADFKPFSGARVAIIPISEKGQEKYRREAWRPLPCS